MADVLEACAPHSVDTPHKERVRRAKIDFKALNTAKVKIRKLAGSAGIDFKYKTSKYPHFYFIDDTSKSGVLELSGQRSAPDAGLRDLMHVSALKKNRSER